MFLPFRDSPNPPGVPVVTYALIAVNVLVYLLIALPLDQQLIEEFSTLARPGARTAYDTIVYDYGYRPRDGSVLTILTSMFLHAGPMHLAGNMLFLWIYGDNVEDRLGRVTFLIAYLLSGAAATLFFSAFDLDSNIPLIGASGAISGVLGFYFVLFPRNVVDVAILLFPIFMNVVQIRARFVLGFYLIVDNLLPVLASQGSSVAYGAHIGGFLAGAAGAFLFRRPGEPVPVPAPGGGAAFDASAPPRRPRMRVVRDDPGTEIKRAIGRGDHARAADVFFRSDDDELQLASNDALELGRWLADNENPRAALVLFRRVLARESKGEAAAWAHLGAGYVQVQFLDQPTAGRQHFLDAIDCDPGGDVAVRARRALEQLGAS